MQGSDFLNGLVQSQKLTGPTKFYYFETHAIENLMARDRNIQSPGLHLCLIFHIRLHVVNLFYALKENLDFIKLDILSCKPKKKKKGTHFQNTWMSVLSHTAIFMNTFNGMLNADKAIYGKQTVGIKKIMHFSHNLTRK